jgi:hypothetical protein
VDVRNDVLDILILLLQTRAVRQDSRHSGKGAKRLLLLLLPLPLPLLLLLL